MSVAWDVRTKVEQVQRGYAGDADRPLAGDVGAKGVLRRAR
jgi:hypothetical protein